MAVLDQTAQKIQLLMYISSHCLFITKISEDSEKQKAQCRAVFLFCFPNISSFIDSSVFIYIFFSLCCLKYTKDQILIGDLMEKPLYHTHLSCSHWRVSHFNTFSIRHPYFLQWRWYFYPHIVLKILK